MTPAGEVPDHDALDEAVWVELGAHAGTASWSSSRPGFPRGDELVNPGTYGRTLAEYLQERLPALGYEVPALFPEDWGWWVEVRRGEDKDGLQLYADAEADPPRRFALTAAARPGRRWRWSRFGFEDRTDWCDRLRNDLEAVFRDDPEVTVRGWQDEFPW